VLCREEAALKFSIITPSFNSLTYLPRCAASITDQQGVDVEHLVVDGGSRGDTIEWLRQQRSIVWQSEPDRGMYDAINKGFKRAAGDIVAYLNCDEQYLPGTLAAVEECFARHPDVDIVYGDALVIRPDGSLLAFRKAYPLRWPYVMAGTLYVLTCATFFRRRIIDRGFLFDPEWRSVGDAEYVIRLLRAGFCSFHLHRYAAVFTLSGNNLSANETSMNERRKLIMSAPLWVRTLKHGLNAARLAEKFLSGAYFHPGAVKYSIYDSDVAKGRKEFSSSNATSLWRTA
jgi:glycosyltransferase involved in cell wall biosynthesis